MSNLEIALSYLNLGWSVITVHNVINGKCTCGNDKCSDPGKHPRIKWKEFQSRLPTKAEVRFWWKIRPNANIGLVTGQVSGVIVLDVDEPEGVDTLRKKKLAVPVTVRSQTGGGGYHHFFKWPGFSCKNHAKDYGTQKLKNVDFRGDGGFVVLPPSSHVSGGKYEWILKPNEGEMKESPGWLLDLIKEQQSQPNNSKKEKKKSGSSSSKETPPWVNEYLFGVSEGERNVAATRLCGYYIRVFNGDKEQTMIALKNWNLNNQPPLEESELEKIVNSIASRHHIDDLGDALGIHIEKIIYYHSTEDNSRWEFYVEGQDTPLNLTAEDLISHRRFRTRYLSLTNTSLDPMKDADFCKMLRESLKQAETREEDPEVTQAGIILEVIESQSQHPGNELKDVRHSIVIKDNCLYLNATYLQTLLEGHPEGKKLGNKAISRALTKLSFKKAKLYDENGKQVRCWEINTLDLDQQKEKMWYA